MWNWKVGQTKNHRQGFDIYGSYLYIYEDTEGTSTTKGKLGKNNELGDTYISIYDISGKVCDRSNGNNYYRYNIEENLGNNLGEIELFKNFKNKYVGYEPEGLKIYNGVIYIGYALKKPENYKYQNILYFGDKISVKPKSEGINSLQK